MLFVLSTIGLLYVILISDPDDVFGSNHLAWSVIPFIVGLVVQVLHFVVSALSGFLPFVNGWDQTLAGLTAGPFGTPWWYYAVATIVLYVLYSLTKHSEVRAVRELQSNVTSVRSDLDDVNAYIDDGELAKAEETLTDAKSRLQSMARTASEYGLDELRGEISSLQQKRKLQLAEVRERTESRE